MPDGSTNLPMIYRYMGAEFYCPRITKGISFRFDGNYSLCCVMDDESYSSASAHTGSDISATTTTFEDFLSSNWRKEIIDTAAEGFWPKQCLGCKRLEDQNISSYRENIINQTKNHLHVQIGNVCDSDCIMCGPAWSSKIRTRLLKNPDNGSVFLGKPESKIKIIWDDDRLLDNVMKAVSWADHVHFGGGEPLLDPRIWDFFEIIADSRLLLSVITNLNTLSYDRLEVFKKFRSVEIYASVDGTNHTYEWIRQGLSWDVLRHNIDKLRMLDRVQVSINAELQAHNVTNLPSLQSWCLAEGLDIEYNLIKMPWLLQAKHAPAFALMYALESLPVGSPQHLSDMLKKSLDENDPHAADKLRIHTNYLNSHRTHKFDVDKWRVKAA